MQAESRKCQCSCGGRIEFTEDAAGAIIPCPHCGKEIRLPAPKIEVGTYVLHRPEKFPRLRFKRQEKPAPAKITPYFPEFTDDTARRIPVLSSQGDGTYYVDLCDYTCTCPDFRKRRHTTPPRSIVRACKHICRALVESQWLEFLNPLTRCIVEAYSRIGFGVEQGWFCCSDGGSPYYLTQPHEDGWVNVYAPVASKRGNSSVLYAKHGFNVFERRWSYGKPPSDATAIENNIFEKLKKSQNQGSQVSVWRAVGITLAVLVIIVSVVLWLEEHVFTQGGR